MTEISLREEQLMERLHDVLENPDRSEWLTKLRPGHPVTCKCSLGIDIVARVTKIDSKHLFVNENELDDCGSEPDVQYDRLTGSTDWSVLDIPTDEELDQLASMERAMDLNNMLLVDWTELGSDTLRKIHNMIGTPFTVKTGERVK